MNIQPQISIIIPIYNQEKYLEECLDCICNQSFKDIEIICVDDGSTDGTHEILSRYALIDERLKIVKQKNQYAGVARNTGMKYATGKYWMFLDSDDLFSSSMLENMYTRAEDTMADIVICEYDYFDDSTKTIIPRDFSFEESFLPAKNVFSGVDLKDAALFQISVGCAWDKLFRAEFIRENGYEFLDIRIFEDAFFVNMLLAKAERISFIKEPFISYRMNNQESLSNKKDIYWDDVFTMLDMLQIELKKQGLFNKYERSFLNLLINFELFNLDSLKSMVSYEECYKKIKKQTELNEKIVRASSGYFYSPYNWERYLQIIHSNFKEFLFEKVQKYQVDCKKNSRKGWVFPYEKVEKNKVVVLYGAGAVGSAYYKQLTYTEYCKNLYWVDKKFEDLRTCCMDIQNPQIINDIQLDYIVVAILNKDIQREVVCQLLQTGIKEEQIIYVS